MALITAAQIELAADFVYSASNEEEAEKLLDTMSDQQPLLLDYVIATGEEELSEYEAEVLLYGAAVIWRAYVDTHGLVPPVSEEVLDQVEELNESLFSDIVSDEETGLANAVEKLRAGYAQPEILNYIVEMIADDEEEEDEDDENFIAPESVGTMFIALKVLTDCLDLAAAKA